MRYVVRFIAVIVGLFLAAKYVQGIIIPDLQTAIIVALVLGILNLIVRPILAILTLPLTILTLGLFTFILNAGLFWFAGSFVKGFEVQGFVAALFGSLIVSSVSWLAHMITR